MGNAGEAISGTACAILFVEVFLRLGLISRISRLMISYRMVWRVVRSPRISDHWKERALPRYACQMLGNAVIITGSIAATAALLAATLYVVFLIGSFPWEGGRIFLGWPFNLAAVAGGFLFSVLRKQFRQ